MFFDLDSDFSWPFDFFGDGFEIFFGLSSVSLFSPSLNPSPSCFSFDSTFSDFGFDDLDGDAVVVEGAAVVVVVVVLTVVVEGDASVGRGVTYDKGAGVPDSFGSP